MTGRVRPASDGVCSDVAAARISQPPVAIVQDGAAIIGVETCSTKADSKTGSPVQTDLQDRTIGTRIACRHSSLVPKRNA
ncbi:hypothetical protein GJ744_009188 [Endocarpon pusillum]|uniref:Uncharacterized protein n=1 Tax=Endocarpon pusillum TaxID=364733 RepID=A0A8H7ANU5_9EURO|nr:hypothetical protein GJ744_009188 [Endocarpon pusillum]